VLLHVIDAAHINVEEHKEVVDDVLRDLGIDHQKPILVFNKIDQLTHNEEEGFRQRAAAIYHPQRSIFISAVEPNGLEELRHLLHEELRELRPEVHVTIPAEDGEVLASLYRDGEVVKREDVDGTIDLLVRLPVALLGKLQRREGVTVFLE
jgi:GTPase